MDYPVKYSEQKEQVSANYTNFAMPYSNIDMNNYDYPFNRPVYWNGCVPPNENGIVIVRSANARNGEVFLDEQNTTDYHSDFLFFAHAMYPVRPRWVSRTMRNESKAVTHPLN